MGSKYKKIPAIQQPDTTSCWSTSMEWWTKAVPSIKNYREIDILGMYHHLTGADGGLNFPSGFKLMLQDSRWKMNVTSVTGSLSTCDELEKGLKKGPVVCGYWDRRVGGYHAVVVYDYVSSMKVGNEVSYMDPNGARHATCEAFVLFGGGRENVLGSLK